MLGLIYQGLVKIWRACAVEEFPRRIQRDGFSCGARSVESVLLFFGIDYTYSDITNGIALTREGSAATPIACYLRSYGLSAKAYTHMQRAQITRALARGAVVIVDLDGNHWSVLYREDSLHVWISNPSLRALKRQMSRREFTRRWSGAGIIVTDRRRR